MNRIESSPKLQPAELRQQMRYMQRQTNKKRGALAWGIMGVILAACAAPHMATNTVGNDETFYVCMLGTRKHRLSGVNPEVGLFYTNDAGATWQHTGWEQGKAFAAVTPAGGQGDTIFVAAGNGVMRTTDGGVHWRITTGWEVTEVQDVGLSAKRRADVFAATPYGIYRSRDFGATWTHIADELPEPYVSSIRVDREDPDKVLAGAEAGLYISSDAGDTWSRSSLTYPIRSVRQSPVSPQIWAAALQDHGVAISEDGGATWRTSEDLDGRTVYEVEFDPMRPDRLLAGGWKTGPLESQDLGRHWKRLSDDPEVEDVHGIAISRVQDGLVIVGSMSNGVFVSTDGGSSWTASAPDIFDEGQIWDVFVGGEQ